MDLSKHNFPVAETSEAAATGYANLGWGVSTGGEDDGRFDSDDGLWIGEMHDCGRATSSVVAKFDFKNLKPSSSMYSKIGFKMILENTSRTSGIVVSVNMIKARSMVFRIGTYDRDGCKYEQAASSTLSGSSMSTTLSGSFTTYFCYAYVNGAFRMTFQSNPENGPKNVKMFKFVTLKDTSQLGDISTKIPLVKELDTMNWSLNKDYRYVTDATRVMTKRHKYYVDNYFISLPRTLPKAVVTSADAPVKPVSSVIGQLPSYLPQRPDLSTLVSLPKSNFPPLGTSVGGAGREGDQSEQASGSGSGTQQAANEFKQEAAGVDPKEETVNLQGSRTAVGRAAHLGGGGNTTNGNRLTSENEATANSQSIEQVAETLSSMADVIEKDLNAAKLQYEQLTELAIVNKTLPGVMLPEHCRLVITQLRTVVKELFGEVNANTELVYLVAVIQGALTYSTCFYTPREYGDVSSERQLVHVLYGGRRIDVSYSEFKKLVIEVVRYFQYSNPIRQFMRWLSCTTITLIKSGVVTPNYSVMAAHGVVKKYIPYCFDFCVLDARFNTKDEKLGNALAKVTAVYRSKRMGINNRDFHNTSELKYETEVR